MVAGAAAVVAVTGGNGTTGNGGGVFSPAPAPVFVLVELGAPHLVHIQRSPVGATSNRGATGPLLGKPLGDGSVGSHQSITYRLLMRLCLFYATEFFTA